MRLPTAGPLKAGILDVSEPADDPMDQEPVPPTSRPFIVKPDMPAGRFPNPTVGQLPAASQAGCPAVIHTPAVAVVVCARHVTRCPGRTD